jgi:hypothetical protein
MDSLLMVLALQMLACLMLPDLGLAVMLRCHRHRSSPPKIDKIKKRKKLSHCCF